MSICNVIKNYEIKCNNIIRKDYITQTLIDLAKKTKYNNYKLITYDEFLELEKNVIKLINNDIEINVLKELIASVNNLDLNQNDNINNDDTNNENDDEIEISLLNSSDEDDFESDNKENDSIKKDVDDEYKIPNLYSRF